MLIAEKYDLLDSDNAAPARAVHKRLGREVIIHAVSLGGLTEEHRASVRSTGSAIAKLDHPVIPHLMDFIEESEYYVIVLESFLQPCPFDQLPTLEALSLLEQVSDALVHAESRGVYHGNLTLPDLCVDSQGHPKLVGLGQLQFTGTQADTLAAADIRQICSWICTAISGDTTASFAELRSLVDQGEHEWTSIRTLHTHLLNCLNSERSQRQAEKLTFSQPAQDQEPESMARSNITLIAAIIVAGLLLLMLLCIVFWPKQTTIVETKPKTTPATNTVISTSDLSTAKSEQPSEEVFVSDLANVGTLNNPQQPADIPVEAETPPPSVPFKSEPEKPIVPRPDKPEPKPQKKRPAKPLNPFANSLSNVTLPPTSESIPTTLTATKLDAESRLKLRLVGGLGAYKAGEFKLSEIGDSQWGVTFTSDGEIAQVAVIELSASGDLTFNWNADEATKPIAPFLANTALLLTHGESKHPVALREYARQPAIRADLERRKPYVLELPHPPEDKDIVIEFSAVEGSKAKALPLAVIGINETMRIGLDAGKDSLIVVEVEAKFRARKQTLHISARARTQKGARFIPIKPGAGNKLRSELKNAYQTINQFQLAEDQAKGKVKDRIEAQIKVMEQNKKLLEVFAESYQAASNTKLQFKIYRQVGPRSIPLLNFED